MSAVPEPPAQVAGPAHELAWPGTDSPLGATWDGEGTNFAIFTESARSLVEIALQDYGSPVVQRMSQRCRRMNPFKSILTK